MAIDAIGSILNADVSNALTNTTLDQQDFIKLFLAELNFQDPLEPVDNKEFLAQMAQFASIEQNRQTSESIKGLLQLSSIDQSVGLLGRSVQVSSSTGVLVGDVTAISFNSDGAALTLELQDGSFLTDVKMSQINLVQP